MLLGQITGVRGLRGIINGLEANGARNYHLGIKGEVKRSTLAYANEHRSYKIYESLFYHLYNRRKTQVSF